MYAALLMHRHVAYAQLHMYGQIGGVKCLKIFAFALILNIYSKIASMYILTMHRVGKAAGRGRGWDGRSWISIN
jgi:uncharacterized membrane protein